jgi:hypothetical protein
MSLMKTFALFTLTSALLVGCASSQMKARKEQRDKISAASKLYCDFINGEVYADIEVALNLEMGKRCDSSKAMTMTSYRSPSEATGIVFCCTMKEKEEPKKAPVDPVKTLWDEPAIKKPEQPSLPSPSSSTSTPSSDVGSANGGADAAKDLKKVEKNR